LVSTVLYTMFAIIMVVWTIDSKIILNSRTGLYEKQAFRTGWAWTNMVPLVYMLFLVGRVIVKAIWSLIRVLVDKIRA
jgi:hypothetical protein